MRVKRFFAADFRKVMRMVRDELGDDAAIISQKETPEGIEVVCALNYDATAETREVVQALKESQRGEDLQEKLDAARKRVLSGVTFDTPSSDFNFNTKKSLDSKSKPRSYTSSQLAIAYQQENPPSKPSYSASGYGTNMDNGYTSSGYTSSKSSFDYQESQQENKVIQAMESEIQSLRNLLFSQISSQENKANPAVAYVRNRLEVAGFSRNYIQHLLNLAQLDSDLSTSEAWEVMLEKIHGQLLVHDGELIEKGGVIAVFGPTGVGKTTTLSKLAARHVLKYGADSLALVTTDCYRIGAYEQLRTVGRILGVMVRIVDENNSLDVTLKSLKRKSLILVDTAGLNTKDPNLTAQIDLLASSSVKIKRFLVMPTTSQAKVLSATYQAYKNVGLNGCILTKVDEATNLGETLGLVLENRLPIVYVTNGQKIPDDVLLASKSFLLERFMQDLHALEAD